MNRCQVTIAANRIDNRNALPLLQGIGHTKMDTSMRLNAKSNYMAFRMPRLWHVQSSLPRPRFVRCSNVVEIDCQGGANGALHWGVVETYMCVCVCGRIQPSHSLGFAVIPGPEFLQFECVNRTKLQAVSIDTTLEIRKTKSVLMLMAAQR